MQTEVTHPDKSPQAIPDVSVVIVSWNVAELLADCLESLQQNSGGVSIEVWVVDNASHDNTPDVLRERFPWVHVIANKENRGFACANNQGFRRATGRYVFILNPDTVVPEGTLSTLIDCLDTNPEVAMVGPRLLFPDGKTQSASARLHGGSLLRAICLKALQLHKIPRIGPWLQKKLQNPYDYEITQDVEAISGAAMLVRREVLRDLEGFGETFIHCGEDFDLCYRIRAAGWQIRYVSESRVVHFVGQSSGQAPARNAVNSAISVEEFFRRCFGARNAVIYRLIVQTIEGPFLVAIGLLKFLLRKESLANLKGRIETFRGYLAWREIP